MDKAIYKAQNAKNYSQEQIESLLAVAKTQYAYDTLIDNLYFKTARKVNGDTTYYTVPTNIPIKTARTMRDTEKFELQKALQHNI